MKRWVLVALCLFFPILACAHGGVDAAKRSVQASMVVTGLIAVKPDGSVYGYSLDHRDKLPANVITLINDTLPGWKFEPVEVGGKPVLAKALMSLRIVAHQVQPGHCVASVDGAAFGEDAPQSRDSPECARGGCLSYLTRSPPTYPTDALRARVSGTVYLLVEINRQGRVTQAAVRQVDLRRLADETQLGRWRRDLARASLQAARQWTFHVPETGRGARQKQWSLYVPINYALTVGGQTVGAPGYGQWDAYVPGPVQPIPWTANGARTRASSGSADAIPRSGEPFVPDTRFVLLTPIGAAAAKSPMERDTKQG